MGKITHRGVELLLQRGRQQGVFGKSRMWLAVWAGITAVRQVQRFIDRDPAGTQRIVLKPGQAVVIRDTGELWGKAKRR